MFTEFIANILFPPICVACRQRIGSGGICDACLEKIDRRDGLMCGECHASIMAWTRASSCHPDFPFILGASANYSDPVVQSLVHNLKFRSITTVADPLGDLLYNYIERSHISLANYSVVPIPLSRRRLRSRGYNQAELIARRFAERANLPVETRILVRNKYTQPQSDITNEAERRENLRGAFVVDKSHPVKDRSIVLIDDVSTTGATFFEAARILKAAGAAHVFALAVAKT